MSSEYALIQLLLREPHQTIDLWRKGIRPKYFKNKKLGRAYKLIYDRHTNLRSLPAEEELIRLDVAIETEAIPQTITHLIELIVEEYNKTFMKDVIKASSEIIIEQGPQAAKDILLKGANLLFDIEKSERSKNITELNEELWNDYLYKVANKGKITGIPTGFHIFDNHTMGLQPQWLVTIAGRNGSFKTWVLTSWALNAFKRGNNVAIFSCEMSVNELALRVHAVGANIPPTKILRGTLDDVEQKLFNNHLNACKSTPYGSLMINDNPKSISDVDNMISEFNEKKPLDIVFIDSAYRMQGDGDSDTSRQTSIARAAKNLAKKYNIPIVCTVQLNRDFAKANVNKEKTASGGHYVYGTDAWNQDSDVVFSLHRPDIYIPYDFSDFILEKFRHGEQSINYILEINLQIPKIEQIDAQAAKEKIVGLPPAAMQKGQKIFDMAQETFTDNENAIFNEEIVPNDVLQAFKEHQEKLKRQKENDIDNYDNE
jgi:replicative DNA helicase